MGRPSSYKPEYAEHAKALCAQGATDVELADFFGVSLRTISDWKARHSEFLQALKLGKEAADERVAKSLYHRAIGYTFDAVKIFPPGRPEKRGKRWTKPKPLIVPYREHCPPDSTAMIFWLKNRRPDLWRDVNRLEHTGKDGGPIESKDVTDPQRARALAAFVAKTRQKEPEKT